MQRHIMIVPLTLPSKSIAFQVRAYDQEGGSYSLSPTEETMANAAYEAIVAWPHHEEAIDAALDVAIQKLNQYGMTRTYCSYLEARSAGSAIDTEAVSAVGVALLRA